MSELKPKGDNVVKKAAKKKKGKDERSRSADHSRSRSKSRSNSRERSRSRSRSRSRDRNKHKNERDERDRDRSRSRSRSNERTDEIDDNNNTDLSIEARLAAERKRRGGILPPSVAARIRAGLDLQDLGGLQDMDMDDLYDNELDGGNNNNNNNNNDNQDINLQGGPLFKPPKRRVKGRQNENENKHSDSSDEGASDLSKREIRRLLR